MMGRDERLIREGIMANKDKGGSTAKTAKKAPQKSLKEKRAAKAAKKKK